MIGGPPTSDEHRCQGRSRTTGERCRKFRMKGSRFCPTHGGRRKKDKHNGLSNMRYARFLGKTLTQKVEELKSEDSIANSLRDELDLLRALASDTLTLYEAASKIESDEKRAKQQLAAGMFVREALTEIRDMTLAAIKAEKERKGLLDPQLVQEMIKQVARVVEVSLRDFEDSITIDPQQIADHIARKFAETVSVEELVQGTRLTPDVDMQKMIDSVPLLEDQSDARDAERVEV